jgi:hypothetical protein
MEDKECSCPQCGGRGSRIHMLSRLFVDVDYYECESCRDVFVVPKEKCEPAQVVPL